MGSSVRVALLTDEGCTDPRSREAIWNLLTQESTFEAARVTAAEVRNGALARFDVLVLPGGTGSGQGKALGVDGGAKVTEFVSAGGGVVAVCAGGYLVVEGWTPETKAIELLEATTFDDKHWARGEGFVSVRVMTQGDDASTTETMWYENGPLFIPAAARPGQAYTPLVRFESDMAMNGAPQGMMPGRDAVIAAPHGKGRVVAFSSHPELSPGLGDWLVNAVRWTGGAGSLPPTSREILLGEATGNQPPSTGAPEPPSQEP